MNKKVGDELGSFPCNCCCGGALMTWTVYSDLYMHCTSCGCNRERLDLRLKIRVYATGAMNVKAMEALLNLVKTLGGTEDDTLVTESLVSHYIDVPAEGIAAHLEIARLTGASPKKR